MKKLSINDLYICDIPENWNELSGDHIKALCKYINFAITPISLKMMMLLYISRLKLVKSKGIPAPGGLFDKTLFPVKGKTTGLFYAASADISFMAESLSFLFAEKNDGIFIESRLVQNHFPVLRTTRLQSIYGPNSGLYNLSFAEFIRLETLYEKLGREDNPDIENRFCAVLYRPKDKAADPDSPDFTGDLRESFNDHLLEKNARIASHLSRWQKNYIRLLFEGCRNFIIEKHPNAFGTFEAGEPGRTTFENFNQLVTSLSNKDLTKAREIRSAPLYDVMAQLEAFAIEGKKMRELSNQKPKY